MTDNTPQPLDLDAIRADLAGMGEKAAALRSSLIAEVEALRTERDGLAAKVELVNHTGGMPVDEWWERIRKILLTAPSDALAEVKREAAADALEQAAAALLVADWTAEYPVEVWLGGRAAATRAGRS